MVKELKVGTRYYFKIKIPLTHTEPEGDTNELDLSNGASYRIQGTSWNIIHTDFHFLYDGQTGVFSYYDGTWHDLYEGDIFEFVGEITDISSIYYSFLIKLLKDSAIENPYEIETFKMKCEENKVNKIINTDLIKYERYYGTLREEINLLTPSFLFESETIPEFNYVYICTLGRYYFVSNIQLIRNNIYRLDLKVDVLKTYATDIYKQDAFVSRNENLYDETLYDDRFPLSTQFGFSYYDVNSIYPTTEFNCVNVTFEQSLSTGYRWVVSALTKNTPKANSHEVIAPLNSDLQNITSVYPANASIGSKLLYYALDMNAGCYFSNAIMKDSSIASYVLSFVYYPFDVTTISQKSSSGTYSYVIVNDGKLTDYQDGTFETSGSTQGHMITSAYDITNMGYAIIADFTIPDGTTFKDYEPVSYYELWIPFVGWVKLNPVDILGKRIIVYYAIDIGSGMATAYVKQWSADSPLYSASCQVGSRLPINTTNEEQLTRQKQNNVLNLAVGLIGAGVSGGIGALGNPLALVGGALSGTKAISSFVNTNNMMFELAHTSLFSSETSLYGNINKVILRVRYRNVSIVGSESIYAHIQGKPLNRYTSLLNITGYTEIPELHYKSSTFTYITKTEIDEIVSLAKNGIIL